MKRTRLIPIAIGIFFLFTLTDCKNKDPQEQAAEGDLNSAREFIRYALDGKFEDARSFMLNDSVNVQYMDAAERAYNRSDNDTKNGYRSSSINIHEIKPVNDSVTIVIFSNSFKNDRDTLKVIRDAGKWLVDLKYLYEHPTDTIKTNP